MDPPGGALPQPPPPGKEAANYAVVRTFGRFLAKRGEAGRSFAGENDIRRLDAAAIGEWFAAAPEPRTLTGLDLLSAGRQHVEWIPMGFERPQAA
jgi:hypothetical protein